MECEQTENFTFIDIFILKEVNKNNKNFRVIKNPYFEISRK